MRGWQYFLPLTAAICTARSFSSVTSHQANDFSLNSFNNVLATPTSVNYSSDRTFSSNNTIDLVRQLNLTFQQQQQIDKIRLQYQPNILSKTQEFNSLKEQLTQMMTGTTTNAEIRATNRQLVLLKQKIGELRFESMLATREILTPEQRQKFQKIIESQ